MAHCGGAAVVLEADPPFMIGLGQAERPGGQVAGTCRPGFEGTRGRSIRADPSRRWVHRAPGPLRDMTAYRTEPISPRSGREPTPVTVRARLAGLTRAKFLRAPSPVASCLSRSVRDLR